MSSVFDRFRNQNGTANLVNIMQEFNRVKQNPAEIGDLLLNTGRINKNQYEHIKDMKNPREIGMYLLNQNEGFKQAYETMKTLQS